MSRYRSTPNKMKTASKKPLIASIVIFGLIICLLGGYLFKHLRHKTRAIPVDSGVAQSVPALPVPPQVMPPPPLPPAGPKQEQKAPAAYPEPSTITVEPPQAAQHTGGVGKLAIIIDDMGSSVSEARSLAAIGVPLTFSIIPGLRSYREVTAFAANKGIELMIHIPMQSKGWPQRRLEENGLLVSMSDSELRERVAGFVRDVNGAVGANNHMGSEFTEHEDKVRAVLETLRGSGLFFVDSVTTPKTVAGRLSRELGMKSAKRNVFLDNEQDRNYILGQLNQAVRLAKKSGSAIAICHPHQATIAALAVALPGLKAQGVTLVPASSLVQ